MTTTSAVASLENRLKQIIGNIRNLPTPPIVFEQIQKVINDPETSVADVASILSEDPAMSVKVLKLTNSAFYGLSREIDSVNHAVMIIGLEAVKNLVLSASVLSMFKSNKESKEYHEAFWRHSLLTAFAARVIARDHQGGKVFNPDPGFSSGLIHDIGEMIICCFMPKDHQQVRDYLDQNSEISEMEAEIAVMGFNHAQLGRQLAITWKLPEKLADTIGYHHSPGLENASEDYAHLINLADYVSHASSLSPEEEAGRCKIDPATVEFFNVDDSYIENLKAKLLEEYMKAETFMKIAGLG
ncbi:MAG: HDOD domain-containing protein [Candidatus Zixiibacteriota bacterium]|nr:MAG: HDOD domain-containing protein [candidate division Zixibacteria bacterium]